VKKTKKAIKKKPLVIKKKCPKGGCKPIKKTNKNKKDIGVINKVIKKLNPKDKKLQYKIKPAPKK